MVLVGAGWVKKTHDLGSSWRPKKTFWVLQFVSWGQLGGWPETVYLRREPQVRAGCRKGVGGS